MLKFYCVRAQAIVLLVFALVLLGTWVSPHLMCASRHMMTWLPEDDGCTLLRTGTSVESGRTAWAAHCAHIHGERAHQSVSACCWANPTFAISPYKPCKP